MQTENNQNQSHKFQFVPLSSYALEAQEPVKVEASVLPKNIFLNGVELTEEDVRMIEDDNFWEGIESVGPDHEKIVKRIKEMHKVSWRLPDPRKNRRNLYKSISHLRNQSQARLKEGKSGWVMDHEVTISKHPTILRAA